MRIVLILALLGLLSACGRPGDINTPNANAWLSDEHEQCVPFARRQSGIEIYGDAYTWWEKTSPDRRTLKPVKGAVMVLSKTSRLRYGHVAVVKNILNDREIEVSHTNWGSDSKTRRYVFERQRVRDVSGDNSWSSAVFWNPHNKAYGSPYAVSGFIVP